MTAAERSRPNSGRFTKQHAKVVRVEVSVGSDDADRTVEQFEADIRDALRVARPHNITTHGGHYIIDGTVCLARDYDPQTLNRKPGTHPPPWAGGPVDTVQPRPVVEDDEPRTFAPLPPTLKRERNEFGRLVRKDKGVKRGPRKGVATGPV